MRFLRAFAYGSGLVLSSAFPYHFSMRVSVAYPEDGRSGLFRTVGVRLPNYTAYHSRRPSFFFRHYNYNRWMFWT